MPYRRSVPCPVAKEKSQRCQSLGWRADVGMPFAWVFAVNRHIGEQ